MNPPKRTISLATAVVCLLAGASAAPMAAGQSPAASPPASKGTTNERHIVLVVWDGLRPDSINDETTPTLAKLAREGVFFTRHHASYPSMTEVNGTAMATGCYPGHSGLIGNREFRPVIDPLKTIAMEDPAAIRKGDEITGGKYLRVPTLPELLQAAGARTVVTGTKRIVILMDRAARPFVSNDKNAAQSVVLYEGHTLPENLLEWASDADASAFPTEIHFPNSDQDAWTTNALLHSLWPLRPEGPPKFSVLWMSDPDYTQHQFGPDSPQAHRALASVDANLAAVLKELTDKGLRDTTDVLVVSDHGFSTIGQGVDFPKVLNDAGFNASREYKAPPKPGDILVNGLGGSVFLYVAGHDAETIRRAVDFLQRSDFAGVIFTRSAMPGTFAMSEVHIDSPDAPDIAVALRWTDDKSATGFPGLVFSDGARRPGQGTHATLSRYDMHNTLIAAGPDFRAGWRDELPSGNIDLAPTIAHLLGLPNPPQMDGRVLTEALKQNEKDPLPVATTRPVVSGNFDGRPLWTQSLRISRVGSTEYIDEGNGQGGGEPTR